MKNGFWMPLAFAVVCLLSGCIVVPFPHRHVEVSPYSGRVLEASTHRPIAGATVMVEGAPKTAVESDADGRFVTGFLLDWYLISELTPSGDIGVSVGGDANDGPDYLLVTHAGYRAARVFIYEDDVDKPVFASGTNFKVLPVRDVLLRRER
jgi:hypothetical protein